MKLRIASFFLLSLIVLSCKEPPEEPPVVLPTNLAASISVDDGQVDVSVTAENANFYTIAFFEDNDSTIVEEASGLASYTYRSSGNYTVRSRAHVSDFDFIERNDVVNISLASDSTGGIPTNGYTTPLTYPNYTLVWQDEFDGNELGSHWIPEIGTGNWGWGNNELQYYREENVEVVDGYLKITAKDESFGGQSYTSSRIKTQGMKSFMHGRIDIRAALPYGQGIWPALWMLGNDITSVGWPSCGEIDIMELVGGSGNKDRTVHGTIHWDDNGNHAQYGNSNSLSSGKFADEFHVFSIVWDQSSITWLRDDIQFNSADLTPAGLSEFQQEFFFIFNVAVGGNWPGSPDASTVFPQTMIVDYVRVFQ